MLEARSLNARTAPKLLQRTTFRPITPDKVGKEKSKTTRHKIGIRNASVGRQ